MTDYPPQHDVESDWHRDNLTATLDAREALEAVVRRNRMGWVSRDSYLPRHAEGVHAEGAIRATALRDPDAALSARRKLCTSYLERAATRCGRFVGQAPGYTGEHHHPGAVFDLDSFRLDLQGR